MSEVKLFKNDFCNLCEDDASVRYKWENVMQNFLYKYVTESLKAVYL